MTVMMILRRSVRTAETVVVAADDNAGDGSDVSGGRGGPLSPNQNKMSVSFLSKLRL